MNANELADMIDSDNWVGMDDQEHMEWEMKAATMLRQLQAENETVKAQYEELKRAYLILSGSLSNVTGGGK